MKFLELLDLTAKARAVDAIAAAIGGSFAQDQARQTESEIQRRFDLSLSLVAIMRNDMKWSWQRIEDTLPEALRSKLDGGTWEPSERGSWFAGPSGLILPSSLM